MSKHLLSIFIVAISFTFASAQNFRYIDDLVIHVSNKIDEDQLVELLKSNTSDELELVRGLYTWMIKSIEYDKHSTNNEKAYNFDPSQVFETRKAVCSGYVTLFHHLLYKVGIPAHEVHGYTKGDNALMSGSKVPDHVWSAIRVADEWILCDVTWDACLSRDIRGRIVDYSYEYFLRTPKDFLVDHYPILPMWQMRDTLTSFDDFYLSDTPHSNINHAVVIDFSEEIDSHIKKDEFQKNLYTDSVNYQLYPSKENGNLYGHRLLDYAGILLDSLDLIREDKEAADISDFLDNVLTICQKADELTQFHNWQNEMYAGALINYVITNYNNTGQSNETDVNNWDALMGHIHEAIRVLKRSGDSFYKDVSLDQCDEIILLIESYMSE